MRKQHPSAAAVTLPGWQYLVFQLLLFFGLHPGRPPDPSWHYRPAFWKDYLPLGEGRGWRNDGQNTKGSPPPSKVRMLKLSLRPWVAAVWPPAGVEHLEHRNLWVASFGSSSLRAKRAPRQVVPTGFSTFHKVHILNRDRARGGCGRWPVVSDGRRDADSPEMFDEGRRQVFVQREQGQFAKPNGGDVVREGGDPLIAVAMGLGH